ncbi:MAG: hypothetical protein Gyms2KO_05830 [Gymnodinialimonas sp.]
MTVKTMGHSVAGLAEGGKGTVRPHTCEKLRGACAERASEEGLEVIDAGSTAMYAIAYQTP